jgi:hypothetical protein
MRKIEFETRTQQGRSKNIFSLFLLHPQLNSGSSIIRIPLAESETYGTFYIPQRGKAVCPNFGTFPKSLHLAENTCI